MHRSSLPLCHSFGHVLAVFAVYLAACSSAGSSSRASPGSEKTAPRTNVEPGQGRETIAPEQAKPTPYQPAWKGPHCFAHAREDDGYACLDFGLSADSAGPGEVSPMDFSAWNPVPDTAWSGHKAIELVAETRATITIAEKRYDVESPIVEKLSETDALFVAAGRGYKTDVAMEEMALENGPWQEFAGLSLRFRSRLKTGDASEYHAGSLQVMCAGDTLSSAEELLKDGRGERAVAFHAPGSEVVVVSVLKSGGGEGSWYFAIENLRIDVGAHC